MAHSSWSPLTNRVFLVLWLATLFSNVGTWMQNAAAGWLMTELTSSPLLISLVQTATVLPLFLFAFPAGSLADIIDKRKIIIWVQVTLTIIMMILSFLVYRHNINPAWLLFFTFLAGTGAAIIYPSWQSIVLEIIERKEIPKAVTLNGISMNLSRAIGPAITGIIIALAGIASPFLFNALSNIGIIAALIWWKPSKKPPSKHPAEQFFSSMKLGLRHAFANIRLRASIVRGSGFLIFASCYWALLPVVATAQIKSGPTFYGFLLGMIGVGAITGSFILPGIKTKYNADQIVSIGTVGTAISLLLFGATHQPLVGLIASFIAGICWIMILPTIASLAQMSLPEWIRGRGIALYSTIQFGSMALGSILWGKIANFAGVSNTHYISAFTILLTLLLTRSWQLHRDNDIDVTPSKHWLDPSIAVPIENKDGPVLVTAKYVVNLHNRNNFIKDMQIIKRQRLKTGAYVWQLFEDVEKPNIFFEVFYVETWLEHLRQHERTIKHDLITRDKIRSYLEHNVEITHYISR
ncbi:MAG: MFS transporter [Candidatus Berkiella sp.]